MVARVTTPQRSDERFRLAIEAAPTGMMLVDREGRIALVNGQVEKLFGYPREELMGMSVDMLVPARFRASHPTTRVSFFEGPRARPMGAGRDLFGLRKDGSEVPIEIGLNPVETPEGWFVLSSIVDITERQRAAEHVARSLREKETLLREIHHQVKNNLQVISSLLRLQSSRVEDPRWAALLEESQARVDAIALVHERLYLADDVARVDFSSYLEELARNLSSAFADARVVIVVHAGGAELPVDCAISCGLVVNELLTNALKHAFTDGRSGRVAVRASRQAAEVEIEVEDDGVGIEDNPAGDGMGLTLIKALARQLGGTFSLEKGSACGTMGRLSFAVPS